MDFNKYLDKFQHAADQLDRKALDKKQMVVDVGIYKDSVCLKLFSKSWSNNFHIPQDSESKIFFSIWVTDLRLAEQTIFYNIHAFKLRKLKGYSITSRDFAARFRTRFAKYAHQWPNVSVQFGPLTLMEGWVKINKDDFTGEILKLVNQFFQIDFLVDDTMAEYKQ